MDPLYVDVLKVLRGARNGFYYGAKVRFMHSLVMAILFGSGNVRKELTRILENTFQHGFRLAAFVTLYKSVVLLMKRLFGKSEAWHHFVAGGVCGFIIFRQKNPINQQLVLYLLSRDLVGVSQSLQNKGYFPKWSFFPVLGVICWSTVMFMFEYDPKALQASLTHSMKFLYKDSDTWTSWTDFVPVYIPAGLKALVERVVTSRAQLA